MAEWLNILLKVNKYHALQNNPSSKVSTVQCLLAIMNSVMLVM
jgi:hypothetical protein